MTTVTVGLGSCGIAAGAHKTCGNHQLSCCRLPGGVVAQRTAKQLSLREGCA